MSDSRKAPLRTADPGAEYESLREPIATAIQRVLSSGQYILGPEVRAFELELGEYLGGGHVVGVANGTDALELALTALDAGPGDLVATVANTVSATVAAICSTGAEPLFVDVDQDTMLMSAESLDAALAQHGRAVKAVVPVHLYGHPADMPRIAEVCASHGARIVEDCAQSHGAQIGRRMTGTWGDFAAFSFYPTKNLGALGDGGAVFTRHAELAEKVRLLREYGWRTRYVSDFAGRNSRLDEIQAAILRVKLPGLDARNARRRQLAQRYRDQLAHAPLMLPGRVKDAEPVYHQYAVRTPRRDDLREHLSSRGIECAVLYPVPIHRQPAWLLPDVSLPNSERACAEVLCLPCHPGLDGADVDLVAREILQFLQG